MAIDRQETTSAVLGVLAALSSSGQHESGALVVPLDWFRWLPASGVRLFLPKSANWEDLLERFGDGLRRFQDQPTALQPGLAIDRHTGERLAAIDRLRPAEQRSLRAGFLFVAGQRAGGDRPPQRVFHPLLSVPVRITVPTLVGPALAFAAGDVAVSELVRPAEARHRLEGSYELGGGALDDFNVPDVPAALLARLTRLRRFATEAARAAGFDTTKVIPAKGSPDELLRTDGLVVVAGVGLYTATDVGGLSAAESLRSWGARVGRERTAFHAVYLPDPDDGGKGLGHERGSGEPLSAYPLTPTQRRAVAASRHQAVSVVSGAAGNGKSHTVAAIACDATGRGESILLAAKSDAAVDALVDLLGAAPGPDPVVFGSSERREDLARRLAAGELRPASDSEVAAARQALEHAQRAHGRLLRSITEQLQAEADLEAEDPFLDDARLVAPGLFDPRCDLARVTGLVEVLTDPTPPWWRRRRRRRAQAEILALSGAAAENLDDLGTAVAAAVRARAAGDLVAAGGLGLGSAWVALEASETTLRRAVGTWFSLASRSSDRLNGSTLPAVAMLSTALRAGRAIRRTQLLRLDQRLTRALPLWIGTLADIEDLLPARPALFDLVILDEASAIDQPLAAAALLRARRVVVVGDPHQLRHVSFLANERLDAVIEEHGIRDPLLASRLDARRNSIFDVAVPVTPATVLDEHFRAEPHLVDFVARRLYQGRFTVATRTPNTDEHDCIEVVRGAARRDKGGVVREEVRTVVDLLRRALRAGERSLGVISPFRAQADALEKAIVDAFSLDDIDRMDLRVGTVHAFQGNERDSVVVSFGVGADAGSRTWRFIDEPHLFAVLATRARKRLTLVLSAEPPAGLAADYLAQADSPPRRPCPGSVPAWTAGIAADLASAGFSPITAYPCGRHHVDVCVGEGTHFAGIECTVHPDGPAAHIERHLALRRSGWTLVEAYESKWRGRRGELLIELLGTLRPEVQK